MDPPIKNTDSLYVNIGTGKSCLFVRLSRQLVNELKKKPLLYYAVEESLLCARLGYYGIGILTFAQLLNVLNKPIPDIRHKVAHKLLLMRPLKSDFDRIVESFKLAASDQSDKELDRIQDRTRYLNSVLADWEELMKDLGNI